jgi:hypothetical protein
MSPERNNPEDKAPEETRNTRRQFVERVALTSGAILGGGAALAHSSDALAADDVRAAETDQQQATAMVEFHVRQNPTTNRYAVTVVMPPSATLAQQVKAQQYLYTAVFKRIGLAGCAGCFSGLDELLITEEQYRTVIQVAEL